MKTNIILFSFLVLIMGCSKQPQILKKELPHTLLRPVAFRTLPGFFENDFNKTLQNFVYDCQSIKTQKIYGELCKKAEQTKDPKAFLLHHFQAYQLYDDSFNETGKLTGYFEPEISASSQKSQEYKYPLYETPRDLVSVDLGAIYPQLKHYRLRGRVEGNKLIPYFTRAQIKRSDVNASVLCYCKSKIDRFFLEVQGSGKIVLDNNGSFYVGYANQNGYKYTSIGKYLVSIGAIPLEKISLQSIRSWLQEHPQRVDEVLNQNKAMVFFTKRSHGATGALGLELLPKSSVAVDQKYIPLGSMLYLSANTPQRAIEKFVFAQDVGGAIKGAVRADYFVGNGKSALEIAGSLNAPLRLWVILPKEKRVIDE